MGFLALKADERVGGVSFSANSLSVTVKNGRVISVPLARYAKVPHATPEQLSHGKIAGRGYGIHGPHLDRDLSTEGLLRGAPAPQYPATP
jgi:hypothetical protein